MKPRIPLPPEAITEAGLADTTSLAPSIAAARDHLRRVGFRMRSVDPVTTELVRVRNGRFQKCFY